MYISAHLHRHQQNYESKKKHKRNYKFQTKFYNFLYSPLTISPNSQINLSYMRGGPDSEGSIDPDETPEERERREKDRRAANNARERY